MKYVLIMLLMCCSFGSHVRGNDLPDGALLPDDLSGIFSKCLNYNCLESTDSVVVRCAEVEAWALSHHNIVVWFKARQVAVNIYCLTDNISQGISNVETMYEQAKSSGHPFGMALAIQSMGAAYMHAGQYQQAYKAFAEAEPLMNRSGDSLSRLQLTIQQLHTCMNLNDTEGLGRYLAVAEMLFVAGEWENKDDFRFYLACYEAVYRVRTRENEKAHKSMTDMLQIMPEEGYFARWSYYVQKCYYESIGERIEALAYCDSTRREIQRKGHRNDYKSILNEQAILLEGMENYQEACFVLDRVDVLADSLDMLQYMKQIDVLRQTYWVDQLAIENITKRNSMFVNILIYSLVAVLVVIVVIALAKRRSQQLGLSRERLAAMREAAADSIQSKSLFLSNMSHDLRTPLNAIVGFSQILTDSEGVDAELKQQCRTYIKQNSDLLITLVNDIVDFSNLKDAKLRLDFEPCEVVTLCRNVVETVGNVKQTSVMLSFSTSVEKLVIETDSGRLQQVLINLLVNATKFTAEGSIRLILDFDEQRNEAIFTVEDTGCGIPLEKQARIFERFEKLHDAVQGVGLGLSICMLIVGRVDGRIWIDSAYTEGARFVFTHPVVHKTSLEKL